MAISNIFYGLAVLSFCCVSLSSSLSCYVCESTDCHNITVTRTCTAQLAEASKTYLSQHYYVNATQMNITSSQFVCLKDYLVYDFGYSNQEYDYRGCIYKEMLGCGYNTRVAFNVLSMCSLCDTNNCNRNPASRLSVSAFTVLGTVVMATISKLLRSSTAT